MNELIEKWVEIGMGNKWISQAWDPAFDENCFYECATVDELIEKFEYGNWCLGTAFYYKNLCFINQVNGGDEWLVIRDSIPFESMSCGLIIENHGREYFKQLVERMLNATNEQLINLEY